MADLPTVPKHFFEHRIADTTAAKAALKRMASALRDARLNHKAGGRTGLTIRELADRVGCSYQMISHVERADNFPSFAVYLAICRVLKLGKPPLT